MRAERARGRGGSPDPARSGERAGSRVQDKRPSSQEFPSSFPMSASLRRRALPAIQPSKNSLPPLIPSQHSSPPSPLLFPAIPHANPFQGPLILLASCISFGMMVTRLAWMAQRLLWGLRLGPGCRGEGIGRERWCKKGQGGVVCQAEGMRYANRIVERKGME